ncbi:hypothetical protein [Maricaulis sp.]|uniref:hypothetical protein n=1 Tax=Maricaulis sp. TaxID=1486257 RepID=UPI003298007D
MRVTDPIVGKLDQGLIFCCAKAERYRTKEVFGVVITARCDIEQKKFPILNYIPVTHFKDWLNVDGFDILRERSKRNENATFRNCLKNVELPESLLNTHSHRDIIEKYHDLIQSKKSKFSDAIAQSCEKIEFLESCTKHNAESVSQLFTKYKKEAEIITRELISHRLSGHYYLPDIEPNANSNGYVALLREIRYLPQSLASGIASGIDLEAETEDEWIGYLSSDPTSFAMPVGVLTSPNIEHVLQSVSFLFGRIGLPDPPPDQVAKLLEQHP